MSTTHECRYEGPAAVDVAGPILCSVLELHELIYERSEGEAALCRRRTINTLIKWYGLGSFTNLTALDRALP